MKTDSLMLSFKITNILNPEEISKRNVPNQIAQIYKSKALANHTNGYQLSYC